MNINDRISYQQLINSYLANNFKVKPFQMNPQNVKEGHKTYQDQSPMLRHHQTANGSYPAKTFNELSPTKQRVSKYLQDFVPIKKKISQKSNSNKQDSQRYKKIDIGEYILKDSTHFQFTLSKRSSLQSNPPQLCRNQFDYSQKNQISDQYANYDRYLQPNSHNSKEKKFNQSSNSNYQTFIQQQLNPIQKKKVDGCEKNFCFMFSKNGHNFNQSNGLKDSYSTHS